MLVARPEPLAPIDRVLVRADPAGSLTLFVRALRARISWCVVCADRHAHMHDRMFIGCASSCWFSIGGYESKPMWHVLPICLSTPNKPTDMHGS